MQLLVLALPVISFITSVSADCTAFHPVGTAPFSPAASYGETQVISTGQICTGTAWNASTDFCLTQPCCAIQGAGNIYVSGYLYYALPNNTNATITYDSPSLIEKIFKILPPITAGPRYLESYWSGQNCGGSNICIKPGQSGVITFDPVVTCWQGILTCNTDSAPSDGDYTAGYPVPNNTLTTVCGGLKPFDSNGVTSNGRNCGPIGVIGFEEMSPAQAMNATVNPAFSVGAGSSLRPASSAALAILVGTIVAILIG